MTRQLFPLAALLLPLLVAQPARAQQRCPQPAPGSLTLRPMLPPTTLAQGYGDLHDLIRGLGDVRSLGIDPRILNGTSLGSRGLGSTGNILSYAQTLNRQIGRLSDLRTLGNPAAEAEIASIVRRHQVTGRISEGMAAEQRVRNGVQQYELKVQYEKTAAQARNNAATMLQAAREFANRKDYESAKNAFAWHLYYNQVAREYGGR